MQKQQNTKTTSLVNNITCYRTIVITKEGKSKIQFMDAHGKRFDSLDEFKDYYGIITPQFNTRVIDQDKNKETCQYSGPYCDEGAVRLAAAILSSTYREYVSALKTIMELRKKSRKTKTDQRLLSYANKTKIECEMFYQSRRFEIYTLGKSKPGNEVIKDIHRIIGYVEAAC